MLYGLNFLERLSVDNFCMRVELLDYESNYRPSIKYRYFENNYIVVKSIREISFIHDTPVLN